MSWGSWFQFWVTLTQTALTEPSFVIYHHRAAGHFLTEQSGGQVWDLGGATFDVGLLSKESSLVWFETMPWCVWTIFKLALGKDWEPRDIYM